MSAVGTAGPYSEAGLLFVNRSALREWLGAQQTPRQGVWLVFGKKGGPVTVSPSEALEEALCHGWIDGQMKRIDDLAYVKYFAPRRRGSVWSARNRVLVEQLAAQGLMTQAGLDVVAAAKADGSFDAPQAAAPSDEQIGELDALVRCRPSAHANWLRMPPSARRTYTGFYLDAKTDAGRARRLERILDRLEKNLKPM